MPTNKELIDRAVRAWFGYAPDRSRTPTIGATTVEVYDGKTYVVLRAGGQIIDIFRYTNEGQLRLLRNNWPGDYGRKRARSTVAA